MPHPRSRLVTVALVATAALLSGCSPEQAGAGERVGEVAEQGYVSGDGTHDDPAGGATGSRRRRSPAPP